MDDYISKAADEILASRKYRDLGIPTETVRDLLAQELPRHRGQRQAVDSVRRKLHNIVAPYLGDPDYSDAANDLDAVFASRDDAAVRTVCAQIMAAHASTRERLPILEDFYARIFACTGLPETILDLACGLNPFSLPWMKLPSTAHYYAYDLHQPRLDLINHFFGLLGMPHLAIHQDILVKPPEVDAQLAFFFKEAHRFEQRQHGCNRSFWQVLQVEHLLVSLPTTSLSGRHSLVDRQRQLVYATLDGLSWQVEEILFENEIVFWIKK
jgi:16S rRNA (guanine(1405)-N(7))-methyltransferase